MEFAFVVLKILKVLLKISGFLLFYSELSS